VAKVICIDGSRVPDKRRAPDTGRGSKQFVLIEARGFYPKFYGKWTKHIESCEKVDKMWWCLYMTHCTRLLWKPEHASD